LKKATTTVHDESRIDEGVRKEVSRNRRGNGVKGRRYRENKRKEDLMNQKEEVKDKAREIHNAFHSTLSEREKRKTKSLA
jgi:hypothetical protein